MIEFKPVETAVHDGENDSADCNNVRDSNDQSDSNLLQCDRYKVTLILQGRRGAGEVGQAESAAVIYFRKRIETHW